MANPFVPEAKERTPRRILHFKMFHGALKDCGTKITVRGRVAEANARGAKRARLSVSLEARRLFGAGITGRLETLICGTGNVIFVKCVAAETNARKSRFVFRNCVL